MITAIFGMAAFAQPAVGRLYLAGQTEAAVATYNDMYSAPLSVTAAVGLPLLVLGVVCIGIAVARSRVLPRWAGIGMAVGIVVFAVIGARCAGSPTAMLLARRGLKVLLVDRATFPSDALSTHFIRMPGVLHLQSWGLHDRVVASGCPPISTFTTHLGDFALRGTPPA